MPWRTARGLGDYGERLAARYLRDQGLEVVERNWRCDLGEIDIVARDGDCLVVCEVKTRRSTAFGSPVEAVDWRKLARLRRLAAVWLAERRSAGGRGPLFDLPRPADSADSGDWVVLGNSGDRGGGGGGERVAGIRIDVVGVLCPRRGPCEVVHIVGALS